MRKSRLNHLLQDYVAGDCTDEQAVEVQNLLAQDGKARALYEEVRAAHEALQTLQDRPAMALPIPREPPVTHTMRLSESGINYLSNMKSAT